MDAASMIRHISDELTDVAVVQNMGDWFFFHERGDRVMPFATVVTSDHGDGISAPLAREGAYRVSIGLTKPGYTALFGAPPRDRDARGVLDTGFDPGTEDRVVPHPHYASQYWVCVLNPGRATTATVRELLVEAHAHATRKAERRTRRNAGLTADNGKS
ncbi:DUF6194 family protein [Pseudonocardia sichuanensis]